MGNVTDRATGAAQEIAGAVQQKAGKLLHNEHMEQDGAAKRAAGEAKQETAKAIERVRGGIEQAAGKIEHDVGQALGDSKMRVEGKLKEVAGRARQKLNQ